MEVNANLAQDVFKDAGESVIFLMLSLKREDKEKECEIIADMADRIGAIQRSMNIRVAPETVKLTLGFSNQAWEYLFPKAKKPRELEDFQGVNGDQHTAPATKADLFLHVRAGEAATTYLVVDQIMGFLRPIVDVVDETHGFHYREGRAIVDFIDGTENPVGEEATGFGEVDAVVVKREQASVLVVPQCPLSTLAKQRTRNSLAQPQPQHHFFHVPVVGA